MSVINRVLVFMELTCLSLPGNISGVNCIFLAITRVARYLHGAGDQDSPPARGRQWQSQEDVLPCFPAHAFS